MNRSPIFYYGALVLFDYQTYQFPSPAPALFNEFLLIKKNIFQFLQCPSQSTIGVPMSTFHDKFLPNGRYFCQNDRLGGILQNLKHWGVIKNNVKGGGG